MTKNLSVAASTGRRLISTAELDDYIKAPIKNAALPKTRLLTRTEITALADVCRSKVICMLSQAKFKAPRPCGSLNKNFVYEMDEIVGWLAKIDVKTAVSRTTPDLTHTRTHQHKKPPPEISNNSLAVEFLKKSKQNKGRFSGSGKSYTVHLSDLNWAERPHSGCI